jgi:outer membrane protein TolC
MTFLESPRRAGRFVWRGRQRVILGATAPLVLTMALAACEVGPDYRPPMTTLRPFHNAASVNARVAGTAPPLDAWWNGFNDPELHDLIDRALSQNLDLVASIARVQQAQAAAQAAGAKLLPMQPGT